MSWHCSFCPQLCSTLLHIGPVQTMGFIELRSSRKLQENLCRWLWEGVISFHFIAPGEDKILPFLCIMGPTDTHHQPVPSNSCPLRCRKLHLYRAGDMQWNQSLPMLWQILLWQQPQEKKERRRSPQCCQWFHKASSVSRSCRSPCTEPNPQQELFISKREFIPILVSLKWLFHWKSSFPAAPASPGLEGLLETVSTVCCSCL